MTGLPGNEAYFDYTHLHFSCLADNANKRWSDELLGTFGIDKNKMAWIVSPFEVAGRDEGLRRDLRPQKGSPYAGCGDYASTFGSEH